MPAIRDYSFAYESTTTDAGLTIPMCSYAQNDLLFIFVVSDTGTPTIGVSSGGTWNQLFQRVNTCSLTVLWKYAAASEADVVITSTVNETYSGVLVAVRDVYQSYTHPASPPVYSETTSTGTRIALPTITTSANDSLVLAAISSAGTSSISFLEDALQNLIMVDGAAEGLGVGWFFKKTTGTTTAYNAASLSSQAGGKCVIEVRAPAGGATALPPYPVSDASILLTPQPGIAFDSNTALTAATTSFGTSLNGKTVNSTGTVATAVADIGLDSGAFMSLAGLTNATTANQMSAAEATMAASRYNIGSRNILTHFRHATPLQNQRLTPLSSGRGVWFGLKSGATAAANYRVWQVHGGDAPLVPGYVQPIVINPSNTDTIATNSTLDTADVRKYGWWTGGIGALQNQACMGPMWAMDTTVVAGGVSAEPLDVPGIVRAASLNKVRFSSTLQGANQMLCLQAIQFGNGGTDAVYLKVNGGAIEFPSKKNAAKKLVNYNGTDDSVGWTFYPGASDTINLEGTSFASSSKYHWRIHASASASASYNFNGVVINGAGDVQLRAVTTFTGMTFASCPTITQNSAVITSSTFTNSKVISATPTDMDNISGCSFTSSGTGYAIEVGTAGAVPSSPLTVTLTDNSFTGYASSNGTTGNEAIHVKYTSGTLNINYTGATAPTIHTDGATVNVQNTQPVTVTVKDGVTLAAVENARVRIVTTSGSNLVLEGLTNASGVLTGSTSYVGSAVEGTVRRASPALGTLYKPYAISGTVGASGLDITALLTSDE